LYDGDLENGEIIVCFKRVDQNKGEPEKDETDGGRDLDLGSTAQLSTGEETAQDQSGHNNAHVQDEIGGHKR